MPLLDAHQPWRAPLRAAKLPNFAPGKVVNVACPRLVKDTGRGFRCAPHITQMWQAHKNVHAMFKQTWAGPSVARSAGASKEFFDSLLSETPPSAVFPVIVPRHSPTDAKYQIVSLTRRAHAQQVQLEGCEHGEMRCQRLTAAPRRLRRLRYCGWRSPRSLPPRRLRRRRPASGHQCAASR